MLSRIHTLNLIALGVHQFEEYALPGGMGYVMNKMQSDMTFSPLYRKDAPIDRYPLNQLNAAIANSLAFYIIYPLPIFFDDVVWLGVCPILFGTVFQIALHCILGNIKLGTFYNPGMGAVLLGYVPLAIWFFSHLNRNGLAANGDFIAGIVYLFGFIVVFALVTYKIFANPDNNWPFIDAEIAQGKKIAKKWFKNIYFED